VGDEQQAEAHLGAQAAQQFDDGRLNGDVERRGDLVADEELWGSARQRTRYGDPLSLAARKLIREAVRGGGRQGNALEALRDSRTDGPPPPGKEELQLAGDRLPTVRRGLSEAYGFWNTY
jgi:hypothetical protein